MPLYAPGGPEQVTGGLPGRAVNFIRSGTSTVRVTSARTVTRSSLHPGNIDAMSLSRHLLRRVPAVLGTLIGVGLAVAGLILATLIAGTNSSFAVPTGRTVPARVPARPAARPQLPEHLLRPRRHNCDKVEPLKLGHSYGDCQISRLQYRRLEAATASVERHDPRLPRSIGPRDDDIHKEVEFAYLRAYRWGFPDGARTTGTVIESEVRPKKDLSGSYDVTYVWRAYGHYDNSRGELPSGLDWDMYDIDFHPVPVETATQKPIFGPPRSRLLVGFDDDDFVEKVYYTLNIHRGPFVEVRPESLNGHRRR